MLRHAPYLLAGCLALCLTIAPESARVAGADEADPLTATCEGLLTQQWEALAKDNVPAANRILARARQHGCLLPPVAEQLCHIPQEQEAKFDMDGNTALSNMARNQQRLLGCQM